MTRRARRQRLLQPDFAPGFSTKTEISDVSGAASAWMVKTRIAQMNGTVEIDSVDGKGSKITIKLPLTLAILPTLMVIPGEQPFAPVGQRGGRSSISTFAHNTVDGQLTIRVRDRACRLFYLRNWLVTSAGAITSRWAASTRACGVVNVGGRPGLGRRFPGRPGRGCHQTLGLAAGASMAWQVPPSPATARSR